MEDKFAGSRGGVDFLLEAEKGDADVLGSMVTVVSSSARERPRRSSRTMASVSPDLA